jgi:hypothetical protein
MIFELGTSCKLAPAGGIVSGEIERIKEVFVGSLATIF